MKRIFFALALIVTLCACHNDDPVIYDPTHTGHEPGTTENKPEVRFSASVNGRKVTIHDYSIGETIYYTFGDGEFGGDAYVGTPKCTFTHTYEKAGTYDIVGTVYWGDSKAYGVQTVEID